MKKNMKKRIPALAVLVVLALTPLLFYFAGCVIVPEQGVVVSGHNNQEFQRKAATCEPGSQLLFTKETDEGLSPDNFSLISWNSHRGTSYGWGEDLVALGGEVDIILLQEAALDQVLNHQFNLFASEWLMATAFQLDDQEIGILSAARVSPQGYCVSRKPEPLFRIPKVALAVTYPLLGMDTRLLVVNIHLVNFTLNADAVRQQIEPLHEIIMNHQGPVIVAGDFNTWSNKREALVDEKMKELQLQPVVFLPDKRVEFFNHKVDGVFYRGLEVTKSLSHQVETSDHNPLEVHFKILTQEPS